MGAPAATCQTCEPSIDSASKVLANVVSLLFSVPGLCWEQQIEHLECFAGAAEVTKAELQERRRLCRLNHDGSLKGGVCSCVRARQDAGQ